MDKDILDRRRLLQWFVHGSLAVPAVLLAGCATGTRSTRPRRVGGGGGGTDKSGNGGGMGGRGS
jgi:hypothetical protein